MTPHSNSIPKTARHIVVGVSDPTDDPSRHRVFEISAVYRAEAGGWIAGVDEQNANAQSDPWLAWQAENGRRHSFPTAAACLGHAVEVIVATVAREATGEDGRDAYEGPATTTDRRAG